MQDPLELSEVACSGHLSCCCMLAGGKEKVLMWQAGAHDMTKLAQKKGYLNRCQISLGYKGQRKGAGLPGGAPEETRLRQLPLRKSWNTRLRWLCSILAWM